MNAVLPEPTCPSRLPLTSRILTHTVKAASCTVRVLRAVPRANIPAAVSTPARKPKAWRNQLVMRTNPMVAKVPQLAIMATVEDPQLGYAASTLSLRGPQVDHIEHSREQKKIGR